jgi:UDP-N-acetylglucosamine--N-acetylmuramyl-(pentapeptide) pyrophosphoryl-undecaprenol N-acetylglucosamine transferase
MARTILLCAGGTGGHLFPAEAVASVLEERGWRVELATDRRARDYGGDFPASAIHIVPSATPAGRGIVGKMGAAVKLCWGFLRALALVGRMRPAAAAGFGGYPTVPPILAGKFLGVPTIIHDQNAVLGRANKLLARYAKRIATASRVLVLPQKLAAKVELTGNPVRPAVRDAAKTAYQAPEPEGPIRLLVFGGSQGARFLSEIVPKAVAKLRPDLLGRLTIVQQCRPEDLGEVESLYRGLGVEAECATFFANLPAIMARSHLVISRSGATTVSELGVIGRPAILVPLPGAIDQDQRANAETLGAVGGAWVYEEKTLGVRQLAAEMTDLFDHPEKLAGAAAAASGTAVADGAERLADLIESVARNGARKAIAAEEPKEKEAGA